MKPRAPRLRIRIHHSGAAIGVADGRVGRSFENLSTAIKLAESKKLKLTKSKKSDLAKANSGTDFLTAEAIKAFIYLQKTFIETLILEHFDSKCYIRIETDALGYAISVVLSQMTSDHSDQLSSNHMTHKNLNPISSKSEIGQWHQVAFFFQKMIPAETRYKTHDQELLVIVEAFKTWRHYLEGYKYEVLVLTDYNNLRRFMDTKSLSSCQVCWDQKLSQYHFQIDYCQEKANAVADTLYCFFQKSQAKEKTLRNKNSQIFYRLQNSLIKTNIAGFSLLGLALAADLSLLH